MAVTIQTSLGPIEVLATDNVQIMSIWAKWKFNGINYEISGQLTYLPNADNEYLSKHGHAWQIIPSIRRSDYLQRGSTYPTIAARMAISNALDMAAQQIGVKEFEELASDRLESLQQELRQAKDRLHTVGVLLENITNVEQVPYDLAQEVRSISYMLDRLHAAKRGTLDRVPNKGAKS